MAAQESHIMRFERRKSRSSQKGTRDGTREKTRIREMTGLTAKLSGSDSWQPCLHVTLPRFQYYKRFNLDSALSTLVWILTKLSNLQGPAWPEEGRVVRVKLLIAHIMASRFEKEGQYHHREEVKERTNKNR